MALQLNKAKEEWLEDDFDSSTKALKKWKSELESPAQEKNMERIYHRLSSDGLTVGLISYQRENNKQAKENLALAAVNGVRKHLTRDSELGEGRRRNAWSFYDAVNLGISFGGDEVRKEICATEEIKYRYPLDEKETQLLADYLSIIKGYLANGTIDEVLAESVKQRCGGDTANKEQRQHLLPMINGVIALYHMDESLWRSAINQGLDYHTQEVNIGELQKGYEGFIYMAGMALIKLGIEKDWEANIDSLYLPINLLD